MSIIIKGMDMPKEGIGVRMVILYNGQVFLDNGVGVPTYQAIEIPTPHGRLIDADDFIDVCEMLADKNDDRRPWEQAEWIAKDMITILEAEGGDAK